MVAQQTRLFFTQAQALRSVANNGEGLSEQEQLAAGESVH